MRYLAVLIALLATNAFAQTAPTVTLTPSVTSGISPLSLTLTWTSSNAATCTASGSWTGTKPLSGSQSITNLTATATYNLDCRAPDTLGSATQPWIAPNRNTDGSALTNLAGFRLSYGTSATMLTNVVQIPNPAATSHTLTGLSPATYYFGLKAYTTTGVESELSNIQSKVVTGTPGAVASKSVTVTVDTRPNPPVLTVQEVVAGVTESPAYRILASGARGSTVIGFVSKGTACSGPKLFSYRDRPYHRVAKESVKWWGTAATTEVAAACG